jgi:glutamine synthetase
VPLFFLDINYFGKRRRTMSTELINVADIFGENVFNDTVMQERLPKKIYKNLKKTIEEGKELDLETADVIAHEMKEWAIEKGATHYTHWFLPLTGVTAEKHDSFISAPLPSGKVLMSFSGKELIKGEPDASSFPSGGLRATFEARGYTAWDCTSPAFVRQDAAGATLCIPTAFCSYTGEALDQKTPLLRSMEAINTQALRLLRLFGNTTSKKVTPSVGVEQEYFLVDAEKFMQRKDLIYTGRTLFGAMPPKGQELDDHYFGTIRQRIASFMRDVNIELWKVGVSAKTQHNEVAPAQHELAPIYAEANIAVDHNQIIMQTLKRVACQHGMKCLLHEKPFAGVNGSGKHDNWSITTDDGINMLEPGKTPHENTQFLLVLACILKAVYKHADLLRQSAADPGNDHRLGANEAPPAIISVFLGEQLEDVRQQLISTGTATHSLKGGKLETGVATLPDLSKDATDRNRTSPFAFTGNKFEFRMVGSRDSVANPNIVLNTIVAEAFADACDVLEKADDFELAVHDLIKEYMVESDKVVFNGNGYSDEWVAEAERRGLPNIKSMVESIPAITTDKAVALFERFSVFTKAELESRAEIEYEAYAKAINIEARTMIDMASKQFIPAVMKYTKQLADTVIAVKEAGADTEVQAEALTEVSVLLKETKEALATLKKVTEEAAEKEEGEVQATYYHSEVVPAMEALRVPVDNLEMIVDKEAWPMPSYGDLIFEV